MKTENWTFDGQSVLDSKGNNVCTKTNGGLIASVLDLKAALLLFIAQYEGDSERESRPEMLAARAAIKKSEIKF